jgi:aldehyde:ferredoxin oxidoreductase
VLRKAWGRIVKQPGQAGKILRINLETGSLSSEQPREPYFKRYLGGRGVIAQTLLKELTPGIESLSSGNKLVFAAGLLTGHKLIGSGRMGAGAKSPLSGGYGESEVGGLFGTELRKAGWDAIIIEGRATRPVYLWICDDQVEIRDASEMWGREVGQAVQWLESKITGKNFRTAVIGPAGEIGVLYANIIADCCHAFGRTGMGAVMGSKHLKGIVVKGSRLPLAADQSRILVLNRLMKERYKRSPFYEYGTGGAMKAFEAAGNLAIRNYAGGRFPSVHKIDAPTLMERFGAGMEGCFNCPIRCKKKIRDIQGRWFVDSVYGGAEYETLVSFGSNLLIDDLEAICKAHEICNRYGMDTISAGATIAFAMECFENGLVSEKDVDGLNLRFANVEAMLAILEKIARREGMGDLLSRGSKKAAEEIGRGSMEFAIQVKGLEIPYHEPRLNQGLGLHYSLHAPGADHVTGVIDSGLPSLMATWESLDVAEMMPPTELSARKVRMVYELGLLRGLPNHLGLCSFMPWNAKEYGEAVEAATGWEVTLYKLMKAAERGMTMMRLFNLREGLTREDDRLPARLHAPPSDGPLKGVAMDPEALRKSQEMYYQMMGWDKDGIPTQACLAALDLEWAAPPSSRPGSFQGFTHDIARHQGGTDEVIQGERLHENGKPRSR